MVNCVPPKHNLRVQVLPLLYILYILVVYRGSIYSSIVYSMLVVCSIYNILTRVHGLHTRSATADKYNVLNIILFIGQLEEYSVISNAKAIRSLVNSDGRISTANKDNNVLLGQWGALGLETNMGLDLTLAGLV